jgi:hypothetical protein
MSRAAAALHALKTTSQQVAYINGQKLSGMIASLATLEKSRPDEQLGQPTQAASV